MKALFVLIMVLTFAGNLDAGNTYTGTRVPAQLLVPDWKGVAEVQNERARIAEQGRANQANERLSMIKYSNDQQYQANEASRLNQETTIQKMQMDNARRELEIERERLKLETERLRQQTQARESEQNRLQAQARESEDRARHQAAVSQAQAQNNARFSKKYTTPTVNIGDSKDAVISAWGKPTGNTKGKPSEEILMYDQGLVVLKQDKVVEVELRNGVTFAGNRN
jgi:hypothetical protein